MPNESVKTVHVLPNTLANRIAAGEVIERPASVVKELLENSIDAGATKINVSIEGYGKQCIKISDDGKGMSTEDALTAIERHATSKISKPDDLFDIRTLGFRGEALPSIASVSLFSLTTSTGEDVGTRIYIEGGEIKKTEEVAFPKGCEIEVRELFYNTPARAKFMKADSTELAAISEIVNRIALSRPEIRINYTHNNREILNIPPVKELHERASGVFGKGTYPKLFPVHGNQDGLTIKGMISIPEYTRNSASGLHLFLNGRSIKDRLLLHAVRSAYGTMLESRRFPVGAIMLNIPNEIVDVNVHPGKSEVRFADSRKIYRFVSEAIREAIGRSPSLGGIGTPGGQIHDNNQIPNTVTDALYNFSNRNNNQKSFSIPGGFQNISRATQISDPQVSYDTAPSLGMNQAGAFSSMTILAQLHNTFILVSTPRGLGIIDQHAAHERVTFEKLRQAHRNKKLEQQMLLFPVRLELDTAHKAAIKEHHEEICKMGFEIEEFGGDSFQIRSVPQLLANADPAAMVKDLLDEFADYSGSNVVQDKMDMCLATLACHASVRANDPLGYEQMTSLLQQMDSVDFAGNCPHGRPVFIEISHVELEKRFGRIK